MDDTNNKVKSVTEDTYSTIIYRRTGTRSDFITPVLQEQPSKANQMLKKPSQEWKLRVFLMKLAKNITVDELNEIKLLLKAEYIPVKRYCQK